MEDDGAIEVTATGSSLEFSIDGGVTFQPEAPSRLDGEFQLIAATSAMIATLFTGVPGFDPPAPTITNIIITHPGCGQNNGQLLIDTPKEANHYSTACTNGWTVRRTRSLTTSRKSLSIG